jgi:hypothetical protein
MQDIVNASSEAAEVLMNGMIESKRLQLQSQNSATDTASKPAVRTSSDGEASVYPQGKVPEKPIIDGLFEPKMPPRPLLEMAKENYEALQAMAEAKRDAVA